MCFIHKRSKEGILTNKNPIKLLLAMAELKEVFYLKTSKRSTVPRRLVKNVWEGGF